MKRAIVSLLFGLASCAAPEDVMLQRQSLEANKLVIRQVYGGGGNSGTVYRQDFIELFNAGTGNVSLNNMSLQYAAKDGSYGTAADRITPLPQGVTLAPGQSYLVHEGKGAAGTTDLPDADATDPTPILMGGQTGRIALVTGIEGLKCGTTPLCTGDAAARFIDSVGHGTGTTPAEGTPTAQTANSTGVLRKQNGCQDTGDNVADFDVIAPAPRNSKSAHRPCDGSTPSEPDGGTDEEDAGTPPVVDPGEPGPVRIHDIQGKAHRSPLTGQTVSKVEGVVTVVKNNGFWFEDPTPDNDPATSEGVFVFTSTAPTAKLGQRVYVSGKITEFRPSCNDCAASTSSYDNLTITEITNVTAVTQVASDVALPAAVSIAPAGRMPPLGHVETGSTGGDVEANGASFDPTNDGLDFHESLEGMRVVLKDAVASSPTIDFTSSKEVAVSVPEARSGVSARGGLLLGGIPPSSDEQPERFHVSSLLSGYKTFPMLDLGDHFAGDLTGVVDYAFGKFLVMPSTLPTVVSGGLQREIATLPVGSAPTLDIATFNLENLGGDDAQKRFDDMAKAIVERLGSPDLLVLEEVQDDNGAKNDTVTTSALTIKRLVDAIRAANGPAYDYRDIAPTDDQDGGEPGGNIRVGMMFRTDRGLTFVERAGGGSTVATSVTDVGGVPQLSASPGRVKPTDDAFSSSRKPLVAEFSFAGETIFVVGNHWNSKGGDDPTFGRFQPPVRESEVQRVGQATIVRDFVKEILAIDADANVIVLGDLNDFRYSDAVNTLVDGAGLQNLIDTLPENERYGYVFQGASQLLDHVVASPALANRLVGFDVVHMNAEFAEQLSDHDPSVARFTFGVIVEPPVEDGGTMDPVEDGGVVDPVTDGGVIDPVTDGGVIDPVTDGGVVGPVTDGGTGPVTGSDAGAADDAGTIPGPVVDAGSTSPDASAPVCPPGEDDPGMGPVETDPGDGSCSVAAGHTGNLGLLFTMSLLALVFVRRRRTQR